MEVSTFELVYKPFTPSFGNAQLAALARRVIQGYFLTVSNLAAQDYKYQLEFRISLPTSGDTNRLMENNVVIFADVAGTNTPLTLSRNSNSNRYVSGLFTIPAGQTALVAVLPNFVGSLANLSPQIEIRGFVSLRIPALFRPRSFFTQPQSDPNVPVQVLLNPEIRGTFLPNDFPADLTDLDFDQTNQTLAVASGKALNLINPEPGSLLKPVVIDLDGGTLSRLDQSLLGADEAERTATLLALLGQVAADPANIEVLDAVLEQAQLPLRVLRAEQPLAEPVATNGGNGAGDL